MKPTPIDVAEMQRLFYIDKDNHLRNKIRRGNQMPGALAGNYVPRGDGMLYIQISINNKNYYAHRIIWAMRKGRDLPSNKTIDHKDPIYVEWKGKKVLSNAKSNLRLATQSEQCHNREGAKGCYFRKDVNKWYSEFSHLGRRIYLGYFHTQEAARAAYKEAKNDACGRFTPPDLRVTSSIDQKQLSLNLS